jgi:hypothetical protein
VTKIHIYNGPCNGGRILATFNSGFIFYEHWLVTFTRWNGRIKAFECTGSWLNYAGEGSWREVGGFSPATASWIPADVLRHVEQWLRMVPSTLLPQIPALLPPIAPSLAAARSRPTAAESPADRDRPLRLRHG